MPPGGHSSSSHHSSSSSHHSSHSSHSSSGGGGHSGPRMKAVTTHVPRPERSRTNQPKNYSGSKAIHKYKCRTHDYVYYGEDWTDKATSTSYSKGYYDENGERFDTLILDNNGTYESHFTCNFCGTETKETWSEGAIPHCPNCGANLIETAGRVIHDTIDNSTIAKTEYVETTGSKINRIVSRIIETIYIGVFALGFLFVIVALIFTQCNRESNKNDSKKNTNIALFGDSIYVESIDRTLKWVDEYESYYDPVSDCYVWYNTDVEPNVWQYWYESISSDFSKYDGTLGWMEYEIAENQWYIEVKHGQWEKLPEQYDASKLWYITGELAGTSYSKDYNLEKLGNYVIIDGSKDHCYWNAEMISYYVESKDCYVRVNFEVEEATVQYWYKDISEKYCKDKNGGWLEYDYQENCWYVLNDSGEWKKLREDTSTLWHVKQRITGQEGYVFDVNEGQLISVEETTKNIFIDYSFNPYIDDYKTLEAPKIYKADSFENMIDDYYIGPDMLEEFTKSYVVSHEEDIYKFFEESKNEGGITDIDELIANHYRTNKTMDVTDWFGNKIVINDTANNTTFEYEISKVVLAVKYDVYDGEKDQFLDSVGPQINIGSSYVNVDGVSLEFFVESSKVENN